MEDIDLENVVNNRNFYSSPNPSFFFQKKQEIQRLDYGLHLLRTELFRLRMGELGINDDFISLSLIHI